jgi:hypothetical protein
MVKEKVLGRVAEPVEVTGRVQLPRLLALEADPTASHRLQEP